jgi:hypothetical protein
MSKTAVWQLEVKADRFLSAAEQSELHDLGAERFQFLQQVEFWDDMIATAIQDGRIKRHQATELFTDLRDSMNDMCMDNIPAPDDWDDKKEDDSEQDNSNSG